MNKKTMIFGFAALLFLTGAALGEELPQRLLIIDDDLGMWREGVRQDGSYIMPWLKFTDPDGGLEVLYALGDPRVKVLGITCGMGCSTTDVCMESARRLLAAAGREDVPVYRGADSPEDLGRPSEAANFIINTVMAYPGRVEIVATAPLTNVATAMMFEPCLSRNWKALHVGAGEFMGELGTWSDGARGRYFGYEDLNINVDPDAARWVVENAGDNNVVFYPNEIMDDASLKLRDLRDLERSGTELGRYVAEESRLWAVLASGPGRLVGMDGFMLHGVVPLAVALDPGLAEAPVMLRVVMQYRPRGGWYFAASDDPAVPLRPVYVRLSDPGAIERDLIERCR